MSGKYIPRCTGSAGRAQHPVIDRGGTSFMGKLFTTRSEYFAPQAGNRQSKTETLSIFFSAGGG